MILDLDQFIDRERPYWDELQDLMKRQDDQPDRLMNLEEVQRFHYLYQRASSDLVKLKTFAGDVEVRSWLENVVARAYSQLHERRARPMPFRPWEWLTRTFPQTFRRHWQAFAISFSVFWIGAGFGAALMGLDAGNADSHKREFIPFAPLHGSPTERVDAEEEQDFDYFEGRQSGSAWYMTHNTKVVIFTMLSGITFGVLTVILLFYNGILIGIIGFDYIAEGQGVFLTAWLLPHGSVELPAIFIGGQAGFVIARALFGWGTNLRLRQRLARIRGDLLSLAGFAALLLVWAGILESFLSQYHGSAIYPWKIAFGAAQLAALTAYLIFCGRKRRQPDLAESPVTATPQFQPSR